MFANESLCPRHLLLTLLPISRVQARALYDFDAEPGTGEVSIRVGDLLTVTRTDVGEGWWEGRTEAGQTGLFPEAYVEEVSVEEAGSARWPDFQCWSFGQMRVWKWEVEVEEEEEVGGQKLLLLNCLSKN